MEDDILLSLVQSRMIEKLGYTVAAKAASGIDAIQKIREHTPDVVIMDISLKDDMDGIEVMREVRNFSNVPVIYLSGNSDKHSLARARKTGYIDFLVKPITAEQLRKPLQRALKTPDTDEIFNQRG